MYTAAVISIGDELLRGQTADTNFAWLAKKLFLMGIRVIHHSTIPDREEWVCAAFGDAIQRAQVILSTGGLGPTPDDATRRGLNRYLGKEPVFDARIAQRIRRIFADRGIDMPENNLMQAYLPDGAVSIENMEGTAPGIFIHRDNSRMVFLLPGPPREMKNVFQKVESIIRQELELIPPEFRLFRTIGVPESVLEEWISKLELPEKIEISYYPSLRGVDIFLSGGDKSSVNSAFDIVSQQIGDYTFAFDDETTDIEHVIGALLRKRNDTLAAAESCTGGMLSAQIVNIPGSSEYFIGSIVSYSNDAKVKILGVWNKDIEKHGAVSPQVARQMAVGARTKFDATYGIAITGIAGPTGGTPEKSVGLVYISIATPEETFVRKYHFSGGRQAVRLSGVSAALGMLWIALKCGNIEKQKFQDGGKWV